MGKNLDFSRWPIFFSFEICSLCLYLPFSRRKSTAFFRREKKLNFYAVRRSAIFLMPTFYIYLAVAASSVFVAVLSLIRVLVLRRGLITNVPGIRVFGKIVFGESVFGVGVFCKVILIPSVGVEGFLKHLLLFYHEEISKKSYIKGGDLIQA